MESYKERLRAFNSTEKYKRELEFLKVLLNIDAHDTLFIDYGCGLGTAMDELCAHGFDVNDYYEGDSPERFHHVAFPMILSRAYSVYFMHSLAHIPNPLEVIKKLRSKHHKVEVTVITPNAYWLMQQGNKDYVPDPTVVQHYTMTNLRELFEQAGYEVTLQGQFGEEKNGINERLFLQAK